MGVKVEIRDSLHKKIDGVKKREALRKAMQQTMLELQEATRSKAPKGPTGNLKRSFSHEIRLGSNTVEGILKNEAPYWMYVNFGTSKMSARNFLADGLHKVPPAKTLAERFNEYSGGG